MLELKGKPVAESVFSQLQHEIQVWKKSGWKAPHLVVILVGDDSSSQVYVHHKQKACERLGFDSTLLTLPSHVTEAELAQQIQKLNENNLVDAILLQLPLPSHLNPKKMCELISAEKDADGITSLSLGRLVTGTPTVTSCTPTGIMHMLEHYQIAVENQKVLIIGRSLIVGLPLFHLMLKKNATVTLAHSRTSDIHQLIKQYQFVVVAVGKPHYFKATDFNNDSVVIDVGIHRLEQGLIGDVNFQKAQHLKAYTPVPGGVGPLTIAMLMKNTYQLALMNRQKG